MLTTLQDSDTDTASEDESEDQLPEPLTAMYSRSARELSPEDFTAKCNATYSKMTRLTTREMINNLKQSTVDQSNSHTWRMHREGRITGTTFHKVKYIATTSCFILHSG